MAKIVVENHVTNQTSAVESKPLAQIKKDLEVVLVAADPTINVADILYDMVGPGEVHAILGTELLAEIRIEG